MTTAPEATLGVRAALKDGTVTVSTAISNLAAKYANAKDLTLHIALAEQELRFNGENGMRFHPLVVRAMAGGDKPGIGGAAFSCDLGIYGEVGKIIGKALRERQVAWVGAWDVLLRQGDMAAHAIDAGIETCASLNDLLARADIVISAVTASPLASRW